MSDDNWKPIRWTGPDEAYRSVSGQDVRRNPPNHPPEPTSDACERGARVADWNGRQCFACWYPQMGGYVGKAIIACDASGCFEAFIWHDGEFPFDAEDGRQPAQLHHCDPEQFIRFGEKVKRLMENKD